VQVRAEEMGKVKHHGEDRDQTARIQVRKALGTLKNLTVGDKTRKRYESARKRFYAFLERERLSIPKQAAVLVTTLNFFGRQEKDVVSRPIQWLVSKISALACGATYKPLGGCSGRGRLTSCQTGHHRFLWWFWKG